MPTDLPEIEIAMLLRRIHDLEEENNALRERVEYLENLIRMRRVC
jgi:hypothetical protein